MSKQFKRSPLALAILALLHESPMHPYRMQRLIKDRGKDQVINVEQRASLYQTISQLLRAGLITFLETTRQEGFPDRTVYRLTEAGRETALLWMRDILSTPAREYPDFPAAVSLLPLLTPRDAIARLQARELRITEQIAQIDEEMRSVEGSLPRLFLLESEYLEAILRAELDWVRLVIADLQSGKLTWNQDWMQPSMPPEIDETKRQK